MWVCLLLHKYVEPEVGFRYLVLRFLSLFLEIGSPTDPGAQFCSLVWAANTGKQCVIFSLVL